MGRVGKLARKFSLQRIHEACKAHHCYDPRFEAGDERDGEVEARHEDKQGSIPCLEPVRMQEEGSERS